MEVDKRVLEQGREHSSTLPVECHSQGTTELLSSGARQTQRLACSLIPVRIVWLRGYVLDKGHHTEGHWPFATSWELAFFQTCMNVGSGLGLAFVPVADLIYWTLWGLEAFSTDVHVCGGEESTYSSWLEICKIGGMWGETRRRELEQSITCWTCVTWQVGKRDLIQCYPSVLKMCWVPAQMFMEVHSFTRCLCSSWALSLCIVRLQHLVAFLGKSPVLQ